MDHLKYTSSIGLESRPQYYAYQWHLTPWCFERPANLPGCPLPPYRVEWDTLDRLHTGHFCSQGGPPLLLGKIRIITKVLIWSTVLRGKIEMTKVLISGWQITKVVIWTAVNVIGERISSCPHLSPTPVLDYDNILRALVINIWL